MNSFLSWGITAGELKSKMFDLTDLQVILNTFFSQLMWRHFHNTTEIKITLHDYNTRLVIVRQQLSVQSKALTCTLFRCIEKR